MKAKIILLAMFNFFNLFSQIDANKLFEDSKKSTNDKNFDEALISIDNALKTDSLNRIYLLQKVKILYFKSDCEGGLVIVNKILEKEKKVDDEIISYLCDLADCLNEPDQAIEFLIDYVEKKKYQSDEMIINLAQRLYSKKKYTESAYYYYEYIKLNPKDIDAVIDLSIILSVLNRLDDLKSLTVNALKENKNNVLLLNNLANYYFLIKDYKSAIEVENLIIKLEYKFENIASRGMLYEYNKQLSEAYEDYKRIVELEKCNVDYYYKILQYEYDNKLYDKVIKNSYKVINCNSSYESSILQGLYTSLFFCQDFEKGKFYWSQIRV